MYFLRRTLSVVLTIVVSVVVASCQGSSERAATSQPTAASPSIEGTYKLMSRELPNGTVLRPPKIMGLFTFTKTHRNFNIIGEDAGGKFFVSTGATYTFTPTQYCQTQFFNIANDASDRAKAVYDSAEKVVSAPVTITGGRIEFKLPDEPAFVFQGTTLTATNKGNFVDVWERVQ